MCCQISIHKNIIPGSAANSELWKAEQQFLTISTCVLCFCPSRVQVERLESCLPTSWPGPHGCPAPSPTTRTTIGLRRFWTRLRLHRWVNYCWCLLLCFGIPKILDICCARFRPRVCICVRCLWTPDQALPWCLIGTAGIECFHNVMTE